MKRAFRNPRIVFGCVFLVLLCGIAIAAPYIVPYDPIKVAPRESLQPPSSRHWFGTDTYGRDVFSRVLYGARYSLVLGLLAVGIAGTLGVALGAVAGYLGGLIDTLIMRIIDVGLSFPSILLALMIIAILGPGLPSLTIAIGISSAPPFARMVRGAILSIKERPFVEAARAVVVNNFRILVRHILPETFAPITTMATLRLANAIFATSSLSFLGLGAQPPTPEWGSLVSAARYQLSVAWWISAFAGMAIMITVLAINMLGDGLRDVLDPKLRGKI